MPQLRIALTVPGAVSLGAYEGGALAALLVATQTINRQDGEAVRIDAIAGASAGSITGALAARALLEGLDPIDVMYGLWVEAPQIERMLGRKHGAPLDVGALRAYALGVLELPSRDDVAQRTNVKLHMALGALRGLEYELGRVGGPPLRATTYLDWAELELEHGDPAERYVEPVKRSTGSYAEASGANAFAFPPVGADRSEFADRYRKAHVTNFPDSGWLWYTDGGTLDNQPLGRALEMTNGLDGEPGPEFRRLHLLINPAPESPPGSSDRDRWSDSGRQPEWTETGIRALALLRAQSVYEDLKQVEKTNSRVEWLEQVQEVLIALLEPSEEGAQPPDPGAALSRLVEDLEQRKKDLFEPTTEASRDQEPKAPQSQTAIALRRALGLATGLAGKTRVEVEMVSPLLLPEVASGKRRAHEVLAGDFLGHFGGFLEERYRSNDFAAGYQSMLAWLGADGRALAAHGVAPELAAAGFEAARAATRSDWSVPIPDPTPRTLSWGERRRLLRVAWAAATTALRDLRSR